MAASDYEILGSGPMCPVAYLVTPIGPGDTSIEVASFQEIAGVEDDLMVGMAVLIDDEILRLESVTLPVLTVSRGCADTIPQAHSADALAWFFDNDTGTDEREYTAASTIGVKLLPFTNSQTVPVASAPPHALTFNWRFIRPYPPAQFQCQGEPWHAQTFQITSVNLGATFTWVERNRVVQADQLIAHDEAQVDPEVGTTYTARVYDTTDTLKRTVTGIVGTTWTYAHADAFADLPGKVGYVTLHAVRDGFESLHAYTTNISVLGTGLGEALGINLGGAPI